MAWVFDKNYNSLPKQVDINKKDIAELKELIGTGFNVQGEWVQGSEYYEKDLVFYEYNSYVCISDINPSEINPKQDEEHFQAITDIPNLDTYASLNEDNTFNGMNTFTDIVMVEREGTNILLDTSGVEVTDADTGTYLTPDDIQFKDADQSITTFKSSDARFVRSEYDKTLNLFNEITARCETTPSTGKIVYSSTGSKIACVDYIEVEPNKIYTYSTSTSGLWVIEYDDDKNFVKTNDVKKGALITMSSNTKYVKLAFWGGYGTIYRNDTIFNKGTNTTYYKYYGPIVHESDLGTLLWKNGSPNAVFSGQTINITLENYKKYAVYFKYYANSDNIAWLKSEIIRLEDKNVAQYFIDTIEDSSLYSRKIAFYFSNNQVVFDDAKIQSNSIDNNRCVPVAIYGTNY